MKTEIKNFCDLFVKNNDTLRDGFAFEDRMLLPLSSNFYTRRGLDVDVEKIRAAKRVIKSNTGLFSPFRGMAYFTTATILSLEENPEQKLADSVKAFDVLKQYFFLNDYLAPVAIMISDRGDHHEIAEKAKRLYKLMKSSHPFLTSSEDSAFAILYSLRNQSVEESNEDIERTYEYLRKYYSAGNKLQALAQVISLEEQKDYRENCEKIIEINRKLEERGVKAGYGLEFSMLGTLAFITADVDSLVSDISEVYDFLKAQKGFGSWSLSKGIRTMYSIMLVSEQYKHSDEIFGIRNSIMENSVLNIIIAQQIAIITAVTISASAAANSSH